MLAALEKQAAWPAVAVEAEAGAAVEIATGAPPRPASTGPASRRRCRHTPLDLMRRHPRCHTLQAAQVLQQKQVTGPGAAGACIATSSKEAAAAVSSRPEASKAALRMPPAEAVHVTRLLNRRLPAVSLTEI